MYYEFIIRALVMALPVQDSQVHVEHDPSPVWTDGDWRVFSYPEEDMCDLGFATASGEYVTVGYSPRERSANLLVTNKYATSQKAGDLRRLTVAFAPASARTFTSQKIIAFEVVELGKQRGFSAKTTYPGFLADFARAGVMAVLTPSGTAVSAIKLDGSGKAVAQLRNCALKAAELDSRDPFISEP